MTIQKTPPQNPEAPVFNGHRGELHEVVFNYARHELGIPIHLGYRIKEYFENDNEAGVILENGERVTADAVVGSDGVRSKARELVLGNFTSCVLHPQLTYTAQDILTDRKALVMQSFAHGVRQEESQIPALANATKSQIQI